MALGRLLKRQREHVPVMESLVTDICRHLDNKAYDEAVPTLEPTLENCRHYAAMLRAALGELEMIVDLEHGQTRPLGRRASS